MEEIVMKKSFFWSGVLMATFLSVALVVAQANAVGTQTAMKSKSEMKASKNGEVYVMSGKVKVVDLKDNTAVINCPIDNGKEIFTVAGPLAHNAKLEIGGKPTELKNFKEGEDVTVKWEAVPDGHLILRLAAK
jgi:hypothetical protein